MNDAERELLLEQYNELRAEIRMRIQQNNRRVISGMAGIGAVAGYALLRESLWLFALIPFIIGIIFIESVNNSRWVASNVSHLVDIESELSKISPLFCWETKYGEFFGNEPAALRESPSRWFSWDSFLSYGILLITLPGYVVSICVGYLFWPTHPEELALNQRYLLIIYALLTLLCVFIGFLGWWFRKEVHPSAGSPLNWMKFPRE